MLNYNIESHKFIAEVWSRVNTYSRDEYVKFIEDQK